MVLAMSVIVPAALKFCKIKGMILWHSEDDFMRCRIFSYSVPQLQERWGVPESTSQSSWEAHFFAFSLFGSLWDLLEGSVWLFRIAVLLSYDFQIILHFADITKKNLIEKIPWCYGTLWWTSVIVQQQVSSRAVERSLLIWQSFADLCKHRSCSKVLLSYKSNFEAFRMRLYNCGCFQRPLLLPLQYMRALHKVSHGSGNIGSLLEILVRSNRTTRRYMSGFQTDLYFANKWGYIASFEVWKWMLLIAKHTFCKN
jgi:hypothetical protein